MLVIHPGELLPATPTTHPENKLKPFSPARHPSKTEADQYVNKIIEITVSMIDPQRPIHDLRDHSVHQRPGQFNRVRRFPDVTCMVHVTSQPPMSTGLMCGNKRSLYMAFSPAGHEQEVQEALGKPLWTMSGPWRSTLALTLTRISVLSRSWGRAGKTRLSTVPVTQGPGSTSLYSLSSPQHTGQRFGPQEMSITI
ncbi:hypothetical protein RRG08_007542 [Elysia crispata]|uniref:Uncharacterized protein n=1 Tax=Elysia crispata TaxID=231223 RepID=A0AAE0YF07_9GAST|nr:hypothetical protein RRG08_007542 [Elysia crispata]